MGSRYANAFNVPVYQRIVAPTGLLADAGGGVFYDVLGPQITQIKIGTQNSDPFFTQLNRNFSQSVGLNINIPIFNGNNARTNYERSKITIRNQQLQKDLDYLKGFLISVDKKLSNEKFVQNAKPEVIEIERKKKADAEEKIKVIEGSLTSL